MKNALSPPKNITVPLFTGGWALNRGSFCAIFGKNDISQLDFSDISGYTNVSACVV